MANPFQNLTNLCLRGAYLLDAHDIRRLRTFPVLLILEFDGCGLTPTLRPRMLLGTLAFMPELIELNLVNLSGWCVNPSVVPKDIVGRFTELKYLRIRATASGAAMLLRTLAQDQLEMFEWHVVAETTVEDEEVFDSYLSTLR